MVQARGYVDVVSLSVRGDIHSANTQHVLLLSALKPRQWQGNGTWEDVGPMDVQRCFLRAGL